MDKPAGSCLMFRAAKITPGIDFPRVTLINFMIVRLERLFIHRQRSLAQRARCFTKRPFSECTKPDRNNGALESCRAIPRCSLSPASYIFFALIASGSVDSAYIGGVRSNSRGSLTSFVLFPPVLRAPHRSPVRRTHRARMSERTSAVSNSK